ncbi:MAG: trypsin-like peptidase domain-containing protein [Phycisphaeraceae bacterium]
MTAKAKTLRFGTAMLWMLSLAAASAHAQSDAAGNLRMTPVARVFAENRDAVVNVNTTTTVRQSIGPFDSDPFFRRFFKPMERDVKRMSLGSGFIIHADGYVVTNAHVVLGTDQVQVNLADGTTLEARVLAADTEHDLAVLKVDPPPNHPLKAVRLGDSGDLMIGEPAIAIGNPLGYHNSVTAGIVSAVNRPLDLGNDQPMLGLIQTDASINPGNSGGPLLNAYGQVIGINTAIRGDAQNIGFAIPVNHLRDLIPDLLDPLAIGRVDLAGHLVEHRIITPPSTIRTAVEWAPGSKDGQAQQPLIVTEINGKPVANIVDACVALLSIKPGEKVVFAGKNNRAEVIAATPRITDAQRLTQQSLGLTPRDITPADRAKWKLGDAAGAIVDAVEPSGPAHNAGLQIGDVLVQLGRYRIQSLKDLTGVLSGSKGGEQADLFLLREGRLHRTRLILRKHESS